jgi:hypothetical protein
MDSSKLIESYKERDYDISMKICLLNYHFWRNLVQIDDSMLVKSLKTYINCISANFYLTMKIYQSPITYKVFLPVQ